MAAAWAGLRKGEMADLCAEVENVREPLRAVMARVRDCCMVRRGRPRKDYILQDRLRGESVEQQKQVGGVGEGGQGVSMWFFESIACSPLSRSRRDQVVAAHIILGGVTSLCRLCDWPLHTSPAEIGGLGDSPSERQLDTSEQDSHAGPTSD